MTTPQSRQPLDLPITVEWLSDALLTKVLKGSQVMPSRETIVGLARVLNNIYVGYRLDQNRIVRSASFNRFTDELRCFLSEYATRPPSGRTGYEDDLATAGHSFVDAAEKLTHVLSSYRNHGLADGRVIRTKPMRWHDVAGSIATHFVFTRPEGEFGISNEGPVPRFVQLVITKITGETPSLAAVGIQLRRLAKVARDNLGDAR